MRARVYRRGSRRESSEGDVGAGGMESLHNFAQQKISEHKIRDNFYAFDVGRLHRLHQVLCLSVTVVCGKQCSVPM